MIGYSIKNLKIIGINHTDLLECQINAITNISTLIKRIENENLTNLAYIRIKKVSNEFVIINSYHDDNKIKIELFRYNSTTRKIYDSIKSEDFANAFSKDYFITDIIEDMQYNIPSKLFPKEVLEAIDNYIDKYPNLTTEDYNNLSTDDFEIKI